MILNLFPMEESALCKPGGFHFQSKSDVFPKVKCELKIDAQEGPTELKAESEDFTPLGCKVTS